MKKLPFPAVAGIARNEKIVSGSFTIGAAGAITATTGFCPSAAAGVSPGTVKTAGKTARYTVTLDASYASLRFLGAPGLVGPADAAIGTAGTDAFYRNKSLGTGAGSAGTPASFDIQIFNDGTGNDTDAASGTEVHWSCVVRPF